MDDIFNFFVATVVPRLLCRVALSGKQIIIANLNVMSALITDSAKVVLHRYIYYITVGGAEHLQLLWYLTKRWHGVSNNISCHTHKCIQYTAILSSHLDSVQGK